MAMIVGIALSAMTIGSASAAPRVSCSLVPTSLIESALGQHLTVGRSIPLGVAGTYCGYFGTGGGFPLVHLYYKTGVTSLTDFARSFGSQPRDHRVTGIGYHAYYFTAGGFVQLSVLVDTTVVQIEAASSLTRIEALAKKIAPLTYS
jgi:hypothetical protein